MPSTSKPPKPRRSDSLANATACRFCWRSTISSSLPLEDAGWEDDEDHPRTAAELVDAFQVTWLVIDDCLRRWTEEDFQAEFSRPRRHGPASTRAWVLWHVIEHELQHGTEIALILRSHGLPTLDL